jgi:hypothetical protein
MKRLIAFTLFLSLCLTGIAAKNAWARPKAARPAPQSTPAAVPVPAPAAPVEPKKEYRPEEWAEPVGEAGKKLDMLGLFAQSTRFGGVTVKVPKEMQRIPLASTGMKELEDRGIELYLKEMVFRDLDFTHEQNPLWMETHPVLPALMRFSTLGASLEAKTKLGIIPLGATFRDGTLPFDFLFRKDGYDLGVMPERRVTETNLENVRLQVGGPATSAFVNTFFKHSVAKLIMKYGVGQTLKMNQGGLSDGAGLLGAPNIGGLLNGLGRGKGSKR